MLQTASEVLCVPSAPGWHGKIGILLTQPKVSPSLQKYTTLNSLTTHQFSLFLLAAQTLQTSALLVQLCAYSTRCSSLLNRGLFVQTVAPICQDCSESKPHVPTRLQFLPGGVISQILLCHADHVNLFKQAWPIAVIPSCT